MVTCCDNCKKEVSSVVKDQVSNWYVCHDCKEQAIKFGIRFEFDFEEENKKEEIQTTLNMKNNIQCPHCEFIHENWWDYIEPTDQEGDFQMDCENCKKDFDVSFKTTILFTSFKN